LSRDSSIEASYSTPTNEHRDGFLSTKKRECRNTVSLCPVTKETPKVEKDIEGI